MGKQFPARIDDVVAVEIKDEAGSLAEILEPLKKQSISVRYMYAFSGLGNKQAIMIFCFSDMDKAIEILKEHNCTLLSPEAFGIIDNVD